MVVMVVRPGIHFLNYDCSSIVCDYHANESLLSGRVVVGMNVVAAEEVMG